MSGTAGAAYYFLPWVRQGAVTALTQADTPGDGVPGRAALPVKLRVNASTADEVSVPLHLYGPGDVIGIDAREIVRVEPPHLTTNFPANDFAFVEFDRPDFPWLFTPARATVKSDNIEPDRLRPWIVLVVVSKQGSRLDADPRQPLPTLECARSELPDLSESWAWAHAQYSGGLAADETIPQVLAGRPQQVVSRLLCPRRLQASKGGTDPGYLACLVPAFEAGRKAGLGDPVTGTELNLKPAWDAPTAQNAGQRVTLPVYYHWEFQVVDDDDFEELVDRLKLLKTLPDVPPRLMDLSQPGGSLKGVQGATLGVLSALVVGKLQHIDWPPGLPVDFATFQARLKEVLDPQQPVAQDVEAPPAPIYGAYCAATAEAGPSANKSPLDPGAAPPWLRSVNLDPRYRVAAGLGAQVVQREQDQLVAAAWDQAGQLELVNQWLRQKQSAREVTQAVHDRLKSLSDLPLRQITAPAIIADATPAPSPLAPAAPPAAPPPAMSALQEAVTSATFRRLTRPLGPLARRVTGATMAPDATGPMGVGPIPSLRSHLATILEDVATGRFKVTPTAGQFEGAATIAGRRPQPAGATPRVAPQAVRSLATMAANAKAALLDSLDPSRTFAPEAQARVAAPSTLRPSSMEMAGTTDRSDPLAPMSFTPEFARPMSEPLKELFQDMFLPGLDRVPQNSLTILSPDPAFIEAYMLGLNHELSRELLWREFPTDLRGTYFRQFWDVRGNLAADAAEAQREAMRDIPRIMEWRNDIGKNMRDDRAANLMLLLIKGDLLLRYPDALIYAAPATWSKDSSDRDIPVVDDHRAPELPFMRLSPGFGVSLLGFNVSPTAAVGAKARTGDAGYFFVIQEHPTEPRFGFDISSDKVNTWRELSWKQVPTRGDGSGYISLRGAQPKLTVVGTGPDKTPDADLKVAWGANAAHMAYITLQKPYRLEIHASLWLE